MNDGASRKCMPPAAIGKFYGQRGFFINHHKTKTNETRKTYFESRYRLGGGLRILQQVPL